MSTRFITSASRPSCHVVARWHATWYPRGSQVASHVATHSANQASNNLAEILMSSSQSPLITQSTLPNCALARTTATCRVVPLKYDCASLTYVDILLPKRALALICGGCRRREGPRCFRPLAYPHAPARPPARPRACAPSRPRARPRAGSFRCTAPRRLDRRRRSTARLLLTGYVHRSRVPSSGMETDPDQVEEKFCMGLLEKGANSLHRTRNSIHFE